MTSPAALPGAALRLPRTAAGRRALYLALLVGGLFALGLLGGQRAEAAEDGPTALSDASAAALSVEVRGPELKLPEPSAPERPVAEAEAADGDRSLRPVTERVVPDITEGLVPAVTERVVPAVGEHVVRPVGEVVGAVTDELEEARSEAPTLPPLSSLPVLPELPESPSSPGVPVLPGLPGLPDLPLLPGQTLPAPDLTAPDATAPEPAPASPGGEENSGESAEDGSRASYGPRFSTSYDAPAPRASAHTHRHGADSVGPTPAHHAPADGPGGALDHRATVDNGTPRHGDAHGLALNDRAPLLLVAGAAARVDADETRDEYRDIPVSPA